MITFYNAQHALHQGKYEMFRGQLVPCFEVPGRADFVLKELHKREFGPVSEPGLFPDTALNSVHYIGYLGCCPGGRVLRSQRGECGDGGCA